jgi:hypothetical protein
MAETNGQDTSRCPKEIIRIEQSVTHSLTHEVL